jgi:hypothetical protein
MTNAVAMEIGYKNKYYDDDIRRGYVLMVNQSVPGTGKMKLTQPM